jgi:predicted CXXCH cytochrome family protein
VKCRLGLLLLAAELAMAASPTMAQSRQQDTCLRCHRIIDEEAYSRPVEEFQNDVHAEKGFGCEACHGGNPTLLGPAAKDPRWGYIGVPARRQIPELCGRCHSDPQFMKRYNPALRVDQLVEYGTSVHGQRLFRLGDTRVATCTDCHTAHSIRPPDIPESTVHPTRVAETCAACHGDSIRMAAYPIPTDQVREYHRSVHWEVLSEGGDLSAPTCNDCHGNHGASPPEVDWVGNVCGQCHVAQAELFEISPHRESFIQLGTPGCAGCHGNHAIQRTDDRMLGMERGSVCAECHDADDKGGRGARQMLALIDSLRGEMTQADSLLALADHAGVEVSQAQFELEDARSSLIRAQATTHAAVVDSVEAQVEAGLTVSLEAWDRGKKAFAELRYRRLGLAVSSMIIVVLIVGLVIRIRDTGKKRRDEIETRIGKGDNDRRETG